MTLKRSGRSEIAVGDRVGIVMMDTKQERIDRRPLRPEWHPSHDS